MDDHVAPNIPNRYLGSNAEENQERKNMFDTPQYQVIPITAVRTKIDLQLHPADTEEAFLNRVWSVADRSFYLENDLKSRTTALLKHSDFYRYMEEDNPEAVEQIAIGDAQRNLPRIRDINLRALKFHHKFIHQLKYFISTDQYLHNATSILYEDAPHGTLERCVSESQGREEQLSEQIIFQFTYELASALNYCHCDLNVMHRAVNPKHVFVFKHNGSPYVKLGGLVFAKMPKEIRGHSETRNPMRGYCAPETIADGQILCCYEYSSDIYSLGMVSYFMAQGRHPYEDCRLSMTAFKKELERVENPRRLAFEQEVSSTPMFELITKCTVIERRTSEGKICTLDLRPTANQIQNHLEEKGYKPTFI